jgi:hypothetical protein
MRLKQIVLAVLKRKYGMANEFKQIEESPDCSNMFFLLYLKRRPAIERKCSKLV